jgi:hypothetical protein
MDDDDPDIIDSCIHCTKVLCVIFGITACVGLLIEIRIASYILAFSAATYILTYLVDIALATYRKCRPPLARVVFLPYREQIVIIINPIQPTMSDMSYLDRRFFRGLRQKIADFKPAVL